MQSVLIVGLGIGELYKKILTKDSNSYVYKVTTIDNDPKKKADFLDLDSCLKVTPRFDMAIICTPNHIHEYYVDRLVDICRVVLVEKPGLKDSKKWAEFFARKQNLFIVKNNMFRKNIDDIAEYILNNRKNIDSVNINWICKDRVPNPGSWFTNKDLAWGGVSRDLIPHLLSMYYEIFREEDYPQHIDKEQRHTLLDVASTAYGKVDRDGVYNVDDYCKLIYAPEFFKLELVADWKNDLLDTTKHPDGLNIGVSIKLKTDAAIINYDFGLCPESVYLRMLNFYLDMEDENVHEHYDMDMWILKNIENIDANAN